MKKHKKSTSTEYIGQSRTVRGRKMVTPECNVKGHRYTPLAKPKRNQSCTVCAKNSRVRVIKHLDLQSITIGGGNVSAHVNTLPKRVVGATLTDIDLSLPPVSYDERVQAEAFLKNWEGVPFTGASGEVLGKVTGSHMDKDGLNIVGVLNEAGIKALHVSPDMSIEDIGKTMDEVFGTETTATTVVTAPYTREMLSGYRKSQLQVLCDELNIPFLKKATNADLIDLILKHQGN